MPAVPIGDMPAHLGMVVLSTRNLAGLRRFYRNLGWTEQPGASDSLAFFPLGEVSLALFPRAADAVDTIDTVGTTQPDPSSVTLVVKVATRDAVDTAFAGALGAGATPVSQPEDQSFGGRAAIMADPEGNRWEVLWTPGPEPER